MLILHTHQLLCATVQVNEQVRSGLVHVVSFSNLLPPLSCPYDYKVDFLSFLLQGCRHPQSEMLGRARVGGSWGFTPLHLVKSLSYDSLQQNALHSGVSLSKQWHEGEESNQLVGYNYCFCAYVTRAQAERVHMVYICTHLLQFNLWSLSNSGKWGMATKDYLSSCTNSTPCTVCPWLSLCSFCSAISAALHALVHTLFSSIYTKTLDPLQVTLRT